jgi:hypothetical protein
MVSLQKRSKSICKAAGQLPSAKIQRHQKCLRRLGSHKITTAPKVVSRLHKLDGLLHDRRLLLRSRWIAAQDYHRLHQQEDLWPIILSSTRLTILYQIKLNPAKWTANHYTAPHLSKYPKGCLKGATLANRKLPLKPLTKRLVKMLLVSSQACGVKTTQNECGRNSGAALRGVVWSRT